MRLRTVEGQDVDVFFDHQTDPHAVGMAAFPFRDKDQFAAHWAKVRADDTVVVGTVVADGMVAGHIGCRKQNGQRLLGYWVGRAVIKQEREDSHVTRMSARFPGLIPSLIRAVSGSSASVRAGAY